jgi:hypothetical protein
MAAVCSSIPALANRGDSGTGEQMHQPQDSWADARLR